MPVYRVQGPDGKVYKVEGPEGTTAEQLGSFIQGQSSRPAESAPSPVDDMSLGQKIGAGIGRGMMTAARGLKQAIDVPAQALERTFGGHSISRALGMPTAQESAQQTNADIEEAKRIDAPLLNTGAGKIGNILGSAAVAAPTVFIPGANTATGAALIGGATSALTTPGDLQERATAGAFGAAGGAAGQKLGEFVGKRAASELSNAQQKGAAQSVQNAGKDATIKAATKQGYVIPPTSAKEGVVNRTLESIGGKAQTQQAAAVRNQQVTNRLAMEALTEDLDSTVAETIKSQPLSSDLLKSIREGAGGVYEEMARTGSVATDAAFRSQLASLSQQARQIGKDFPQLKTAGAGEINRLVKGLNVSDFDARSGVELVKNLRAEASGNLSFQASADPGKQALGKAQRAAADALDELLERNAANAGRPELGNALRDARRLIAKTYTIENALNESTGNVLARQLGKQLDKGKPLSPKLETIAKFANAFPKAADEITSSPGVSALDFFGSSAASIGTGNPMFMAGLLARPAVRSGVLSAPYQNALARPSYGPGALQKTTMNALRAAPAVGLPAGIVTGNELGPYVAQ